MPSTQRQAGSDGHSMQADVSRARRLISGVVYVSTLAERTFALSAATGRKLWEFFRREVLARGRGPEQLYLARIHDRLFALLPR